MDESSPGSRLESADGPGGHRRRRLWRHPALLTALVSLLAVELGLRALLAFDLPALGSVALRLRRPELFSEPHEELFWKLRMAWSEKARRRRAPRYDERLGWTSRLVLDDYDHVDRASLGARTPVLLYGDSFAACVTSAEDCWQGILEASELAGDSALINYGAPGYGLDQIVQLFEASADLWRAERPRVVISLLLDDDIDRARLGLRGWPKPRFTWDGDQLRAPQGVVPRDGPASLALDPPRVASYLLRWVVFGSGLAPEPLRNRLSRKKAAHEETRALGRALLQRLAAELAARELEAFVLVFQGPSCLGPGGGRGGWREDLLLPELERLGLPYVLARRELRGDAEGTGRAPGDYFYSDPKLLDHLTPLGNRTAFGALRRGLAGAFDGGSGRDASGGR